MSLIWTLLVWLFILCDKESSAHLSEWPAVLGIPASQGLAWQSGSCTEITLHEFFWGPESGKCFHEQLGGSQYAYTQPRTAGCKGKRSKENREKLTPREAPLFIYIMPMFVLLLFHLPLNGVFRGVLYLSSPLSLLWLSSRTVGRRVTAAGRMRFSRYG